MNTSRPTPQKRQLRGDSVVRLIYICLANSEQNVIVNLGINIIHLRFTLLLKRYRFIDSDLYRGLQALMSLEQKKKYKWHNIVEVELNDSLYPDHVIMYILQY